MSGSGSKCFCWGWVGGCQGPRNIKSLEGLLNSKGIDSP